MRAYIPGYDLIVPESLSEALGLLAREPGVWQPFAGGTDLMVLLEAGKLSHKRFLSLSKLDDLRGIEVTADAVILGALTTYTEVLRNSVLRSEFPLLCSAARKPAASPRKIAARWAETSSMLRPRPIPRPHCWSMTRKSSLFPRVARWLPYHGFHTRL